MANNGVLLDTSFFLRLLKEKDPLFSHADGYYRYFMLNEIPMVVSTISIAEFCVKGSIDELPLLNLRILPFNVDHAKRAGVFAGIVYSNRGTIDLPDRKIIPNDTKLFAQADIEVGISSYLTSDGESKKIFEVLKTSTSPPGFQFVDLTHPHSEAFGVLDL